MTDHEKRIREALEAGPVQYACHADGEVSQSCAFDAGQYLRDCRIAVRLNAKGQRKTDCEQWKPLNLDASKLPVTATDLRALLADLDAMRGALEKLTFAVDLAEDGCTNGGFGPGYENGLGIECGSVLESARAEARAALKGASHE